MSDSRRNFLKKLGLLAGGAVVYETGVLNLGKVYSEAFSTSSPGTSVSKLSNSPIKNVIVACQENHSFDTYYGYYPGAGSYGVPSGYYEPRKNGDKEYPYKFSLPVSSDPNEGWTTYHDEYDDGKMNGFYTAGGGEKALGYYDQDYLGYYYSLAESFTLCGNYFCYALTETIPNRIGLFSATSGGNTTNSISAGSLTYPTIVDLLDKYKISWKCYNLGIGTGFLEGFEPLYYFEKWWLDSRLYYTEDDYYNDLSNGTLPQVSFLITEALISEHPPADIVTGEDAMQSIISALMSSSYWNQSAFFLTYDEHGGYFEHVAPRQFDAYGEGMRVPMLVVSPYAKPNYVSGQLNEHSSVPKFIEGVFDLPTLASINHEFDEHTPRKNNQAAAPGAKYGPPAPPRDKYPQIGDLSDAFDFSQEPRNPLLATLTA